MPSLLLLGDESGRLVNVSAGAGACWSAPRVARGMAAGDLDNDGRVDAVVVSQNGPLAYFHNRSAPAHFITLALEGTASNRDGVGSVVTITAGGRRQRLWRAGGGSYLSASDSRLHLGLGDATRVDSIEVRWPSGHVDHVLDLPADHGYRLRERDPRPATLPGYASINQSGAGGARVDRASLRPTSR
jgi:hypothetical protein